MLRDPAATGVVTVITLAPIVARPRVLATFARSASSLLAVSFAAGLVAWGAGQASSALSHPLQRLTSKAVFAFVATFRADAFHDADAFVVGTPRFEVEIAPACSGYEGIGLIVVFQVVFLWTHRRVLRFPWSLILIPLGALIAACANVVRLAVLVLVGEQAPAVAQGGFHSYAGALLFSGIALLTAFAAHGSAPSRCPRRASRPMPDPCATARRRPTLISCRSSHSSRRRC